MASSTLSPLSRADGSAQYSFNGYSVLCAVNGPMEAQRRDELPEEAVVDVAIIPATGIAGVTSKHLESIVQKALRQIVLVAAHARSLIQITLQIIATPESDHQPARLHQSFSSIAVLPALLQASILALLSTSIPLCMFTNLTSVAVGANGDVALDPSVEEVDAATSLHVIGFSSQGDLLIAESEGSFNIATWEQVSDIAAKVQVEVKALGESFKLEFAERQNAQLLMEPGAFELYEEFRFQVNRSWNVNICRHDVDADVGPSTILLNKNATKDQTDFYMPYRWLQTWPRV